MVKKRAGIEIKLNVGFAYVRTKKEEKKTDYSLGVRRIEPLVVGHWWWCLWSGEEKSRFAYEKKEKNGARIKIKLAWLFIAFNVWFAYEKKRKADHSLGVCVAASPTENSEVTPCWLSFKRADIGIELAWLFINFHVGFAYVRKKKKINGSLTRC